MPEDVDVGELELLARAKKGDRQAVDELWSRKKESIGLLVKDKIGPLPESDQQQIIEEIRIRFYQRTLRYRPRPWGFSQFVRSLVREVCAEWPNLWNLTATAGYEHLFFLMKKSSPPHYVLAAIWCKGLEWPQRDLVNELSEERFKEIEDLEKDGNSHLPPTQRKNVLSTLALKELSVKMERWYAVQSRLPADYVQQLFRELSTLEECLTGTDPTERSNDISHWCESVKRRLAAFLRPPRSQSKRTQRGKEEEEGGNGHG